MCSRFPSAAVLLVTSALIGCAQHERAPRVAAPAQAPARVLHVVADPNNLPFSNDRGEGFENKIADLLARDLDAIEALAAERESLWRRVSGADFLTADEKREAVGYSRRP